jgi:hypothetical protein
MGQEISKPNTKKKKKSETVWIPFWGALITAIATITVALLSSPVIIKWLELRQTPSPTIAPSASSIPATQIINPVDPIMTSTPDVIHAPTFVLATNPPVFTPTLSNLAPGMRVIITATRTSGKAPLNVNFNAGDSYLLTDDGKIVKCGACSFTWSIRLGSKFIYGPEKKDASFSFTFAKKGSYFVIVKVCRNSENEACQTSGITIAAN